MAVNGNIGTEVSHRMGEETKVLGTSRNVRKKRSLHSRAKMGVLDGILILSVLHGCMCIKNRVIVLGISLRTIYSVRRETDSLIRQGG